MELSVLHVVYQLKPFFSFFFFLNADTISYEVTTISNHKLVLLSSSQILRVLLVAVSNPSLKKRLRHATCHAQKHLLCIRALNSSWRWNKHSGQEPSLVTGRERAQVVSSQVSARWAMCCSCSSHQMTQTLLTSQQPQELRHILTSKNHQMPSYLPSKLDHPLHNWVE